MTERTHRSIGEVIESLTGEFPDITISKVRFLETQSLVNPERAASGYRRYRDSDVSQLRWVLRQQRDQFLPLRVIRDRLRDRELTPEELDDAATPASPPRVDAMRRPDTDTELTGQELAERSGISVDHLAAMEKVGLLAPRSRRGRPIYSADDLTATRLVARFLTYGIEPRHLRSFKVAADRETSLIQQCLAAVSNTSSAAETTAELIRLGDDLRSLLLRQAVHHRG